MIAGARALGNQTHLRQRRHGRLGVIFNQKGEGVSEFLQNFDKKLVIIENGRKTEVIHHKLTLMELSIVLFNSVSIYSSILYVSSISLKTV